MLSLAQIWDHFLVPVDDAGSRLYHVNLLVCAVLISAWMLCNREQFPSLRNDFKRLVLNRKYWWNRSTKLDYKIYLFNSVLKVLLFIPFLDFTFEISRWTSQYLVQLNGDFATFKPTPIALISLTLGAFVWDDLLRFGQHFLMHKIPFLWRLHSLHHSARILTPLTLYRTHPLESALATLRNSLSLGTMTGLFIFLFNAQFSFVTLFGVNAFGFVFNLLGANLRHSHIPISFGRLLESIFISPKQHQIHHSNDLRHLDKNFGVSLAIWDRIAGTLVYSGEAGRLRFGTIKWDRLNAGLAQNPSVQNVVAIANLDQQQVRPAAVFRA